MYKFDITKLLQLSLEVDVIKVSSSLTQCGLHGYLISRNWGLKLCIYSVSITTQNRSEAKILYLKKYSLQNSS